MPRHLLTVWNPSYSASAMDQHLACLLGWVARRDAKRCEEDDVYVWWGKLASPNRQQPLPHLADVLALDAQVKAGEETHLYLTDYRSLYVAEVGEVTRDDVRQEPGERDHMPAYYLEPGRRADCWFRLFDIRLLVADDTVGVIEALRPLRNTRYHDRPVSLYGGITDLPLIVTHQAPRSWFGDREALLDSRLWAERDARARGQTERMAAELRDNLIGRTLWAALDPGSRVFLASAEAVFRAHRDDPGFDFAVPAVEYAKAVEVEVNAILQRRPHETLGQLRHLLLKDSSVRTRLQGQVPHDHLWMTGELPARLEGIADLRNPGAHREHITHDQASSLRDTVLGIGQEGLIARLARVRLRNAG